jgi:hypothetical protein
VGEKVVKRAKAGISVQVVQTIAKIKIENVSVLPLRFDILNIRVEKQQFTRARCESRLFLFAGKGDVKSSYWFEAGEELALEGAAAWT